MSELFLKIIKTRITFMQLATANFYIQTYIYKPQLVLIY